MSLLGVALAAAAPSFLKSQQHALSQSGSLDDGQLAQAPQMSCPANLRSATESECWLEHLPSHRQLRSIDATDKPGGCLFDRVNEMAVFNQNHTGAMSPSAKRRYDLICVADNFTNNLTTSPSPAPSPSPSPLPSPSPSPSLACGTNHKSTTEKCWGETIAKTFPSIYVCNVSKLPAHQSFRKLHPALDPNNIEDFLLPPNTHLFLFGESHIRSVRYVLISAAMHHNRPVVSEFISMSDMCDESPSGLPASTTTCGLFGEDHTCQVADYVRDTFVSESGNSSITTVANHMQYLVPSSPLEPPDEKHSKALNDLLATAQPPFTHAHVQFAHDRSFFTERCGLGGANWSLTGGGELGEVARRTSIGDESETPTPCDIRKPACAATSPLVTIVKHHIPNVGLLGGTEFRHGLRGISDSTACNRIHHNYSADILEDEESKFDSAGQLVHVHACDAICKVGNATGALGGGLGHYGSRDPYEDTLCFPAEGTAVAWEVLRSAGVLGCPPEWEACDPLEFQPLWVLAAREGPSLWADPGSGVPCPSGERTATKGECYDAAVEAVGKEQVTDPLVVVHEWGYPTGCSYSRADKHPIFNDNPQSKNVTAGYPLVCTKSRALSHTAEPHR